MSLHVEQLRGGLVETVHPIAAAVADLRGVREALGAFSCFWRSSSKPLQLLTSLEQLPAPELATLTDADLAIGAASHGATPTHVAAVERLLTRFDLDPAGLRCGAHWPSHEASARALARAGGEAWAIHNNCSGKHTFMLAATRAQGWDADYRPAEHPLQRRNAERVVDWTGEDAPSAVDGCGVPTFHSSLAGMARAFARLAHEMRGDGLAGRVGWAMHREVELTSAPGEIDERLVRAARAPVTAKRGAEGLLVLALPDVGVGVAVKCLTGNGPALAVGVEAVLARWFPGLLPEGALAGHEVVNVAGAVVGARRTVWS